MNSLLIDPDELVIDHDIKSFMEITLTPASFNLSLISYSVVGLTDLVNSLIIVTSYPSFLASKAVLPTQKSKASPQTTT